MPLHRLLHRRFVKAAVSRHQRRACGGNAEATQQQNPKGEKVVWWAMWRSEKGRRWLKIGAGVYLVALGAAYCGLWYKQGMSELQQEAINNNRLRLGGRLQLTDHNGRAFDTEEDLAGKWWVIYFGFASCPTVCPAELTKITETITELEKQFGEGCITPVFVTLDPDRDTPEAVKKFLKPYHKNFIGLTGTEAEIADAAKKFRVYYSVIDTEDQDLQPGETPTDYQLDHSCIIYVMNPKGVFCDFFSKETNGEVAVEKVARHLDGTMDYIHEKV